MTKETENWEEVKSPWVKFTKIGDHIIGTLVGIREVASRLPGKEGQMTKVYEIKSSGGEFHDVDDSKNLIEEAIIIGEGDIWNVGGGSKEKPSILDSQFRNIATGQIVKIVFDSEKAPKTKGFNAMKVKKVYTNGKMDEAWIEEQAAVNTEDVPF